MEFLGYIILNKKVNINLLKITTIIEWSLFKNIKKILFFLGFCNFYKKFILTYNKIALPITNLTKRKRKFD